MNRKPPKVWIANKLVLRSFKGISLTLFKMPFFYFFNWLKTHMKAVGAETVKPSCHTYQKDASPLKLSK
uniref:Uncharacterized protein n=1 Tax=Rhizophora mucronata TaxID=61149 RepID=A0A2P2QR58_RHIMU